MRITARNRLLPPMTFWGGLCRHCGPGGPVRAGFTPVRAGKSRLACRFCGVDAQSYRPSGGRPASLSLEDLALMPADPADATGPDGRRLHRSSAGLTVVGGMPMYWAPGSDALWQGRFLGRRGRQHRRAAGGLLEIRRTSSLKTSSAGCTGSGRFRHQRIPAPHQPHAAGQRLRHKQARNSPVCRAPVPGQRPRAKTGPTPGRRSSRGKGSCRSPKKPTHLADSMEAASPSSFSRSQGDPAGIGVAGSRSQASALSFNQAHARRRSAPRPPRQTGRPVGAGTHSGPIPEAEPTPRGLPPSNCPPVPRVRASSCSGSPRNVASQAWLSPMAPPVCPPVDRARGAPSSSPAQLRLLGAPPARKPGAELGVVLV